VRVYAINEAGLKGYADTPVALKHNTDPATLPAGAPVMLLDEATSALDAANERMVQKALDQALEDAAAKERSLLDLTRTMANAKAACARSVALMRRMASEGFVLERHSDGQHITHSDDSVFAANGFIDEQSPVRQLNLIDSIGSAS
jgi:ABC-type methionine transport system ATPase subunit